MSAIKPTIPKGTRDFSPMEMVRRNYIFDTIRNVFQRYGYQPIETPSIERLETLTGKYGEEGDKLLYKIRSNKSLKARLSKEKAKQIEKIYKYWLPQESELALRYDLTVPFARYVVQHQNDITFPFKRYQIQPVWRADRPQKGRYREFYQCDVDVIGSDSLLNEVELIQIINEVITNLNFKVTININNRKILQGITEYFRVPDKLKDFIVALDKLGKIGIEGVEKELSEKGLKNVDLRKIILRKSVAQKNLSESNSMILNEFDNIFNRCNSQIGLEGVKELRYIFNTIIEVNKSANINMEFNPSLARGLDYYTGTIIEVTTEELPVRLCGGGRYDDLTGVFGLPNVSGVGVSFGADRIYNLMDEQQLFPDSVQSITKVMFVNFGKEEEKECLKYLIKIREAGISAEIYPLSAKMKKQMTYANANGIPYVALVGSQELKNKKITLKDMVSGEQKSMSVNELVRELKY